MDSERECILSAEEVLEVGNRVVGVPHEEALSLSTVVFVAVNVGQDGRYLAVCRRRVSRLRAETTQSVHSHLHPHWQ